MTLTKKKGVIMYEGIPELSRLVKITEITSEERVAINVVLDKRNVEETAEWVELLRRRNAGNVPIPDWVRERYAEA